jgi:hypothetical protein
VEFAQGKFVAQQQKRRAGVSPSSIKGRSSTASGTRDLPTESVGESASPIVSHLIASYRVGSGRVLLYNRCMRNPAASPPFVTDTVCCSQFFVRQTNQ